MESALLLGRLAACRRLAVHQGVVNSLDRLVFIINPPCWIEIFVMMIILELRLPMPTIGIVTNVDHS